MQGRIPLRAPWPISSNFPRPQESIPHPYLPPSRLKTSPLSMGRPQRKIMNRFRHIPEIVCCLVSVLCMLLSACGPLPAIAPPIEVAFYRLRIECTTTSDWTTLAIQNPDGILTTRLVETSGMVGNPYSDLSYVAFGQPLESAKAGERVGITVDLALTSDAIDQPLNFLLQKGLINKSTVRVSLTTANQTQLVREISHESTFGNHELNPLEFQVDLKALADDPPLVAQIQRTETPKMLLAFYYPWYGIQYWSHAALSDWPMILYASDNPSAIERHIEQAQSAGIDGFICHWFDPGSESDDNLALILDIAKEKDFAIGIFFMVLVEGGPLEKEEIRRSLAYVISTYGDHPAMMQVNGKPLIAFYGGDSVPMDTWEDVFEDLHTQGLDATTLAMGHNIDSLSVFDGLYEYGIYARPDPQETAAIGRAVHNFPLLADTPTAKMWAATIEPGYDDRLIEGLNLFLPREEGAFYRSTFDAALGSDPDWIFITSWNNWIIHNHIEPSVGFGDQYLLITREFAREWKGR